MSATTNPRKGPVEILIAEDSPTQAEQLRHLLEQDHYRVTVANNGKQALALLGEHAPTLVITDILMPEMDGFELCQRIKADERTQRIPVILLTSLTSSGDVLDGLACGADNFITKPCSADYLLSSIERILTNRELSKTERVRVGVEISFEGKKRFISADQQQMLSLLISTYEAAVHRNTELIRTQDELRTLNERLESLVEERTAELRRANEDLRTEITERKRAEEERENLEAQLLQAQKMEAVGRLAGGVAHDFNNILQAINGYSQLLLDRLPEQDETHGFAGEIAKGATRAAALTRQLLAFARKQTIAPQVLDLNDAIESMLKMLKRLIGEDIDLLWQPARDLWPVKIDPTQIDQILANLLVNARDAIAGVGKVTIETGKAEFDEEYCAHHTGFVPGQYAMLAVSDSGCGMDKETMAKIFEPFFTTKPQGQGTGLGLAMIYGIVKQNAGFINVYSEPGEGTTFRIYLPRSTDGEIPQDEFRKAVETKVGTETILLVEDEESVLTLAKTLLEQLGYTVLAAGSPRQAIQLAGDYAGDIHLLVTDVVMPEMSGRDLQQRLSALRPGLKCLFMSGYTANAVAHHGVLEAGIHFLQKPFSRGTFAAKLREALE